MTSPTGLDCIDEIAKGSKDAVDLFDTIGTPREKQLRAHGHHAHPRRGATQEARGEDEIPTLLGRRA
jgi:succinate dehydrogenase/fumarate reductase flavoprotein subunit